MELKYKWEEFKELTKKEKKRYYKLRKDLNINRETINKMYITTAEEIRKICIVD